MQYKFDNFMEIKKTELRIDSYEFISKRWV